MIGFGFANGNELSIDHVQVVAFYEPETGDIRHVHTVTTIRGAKRVSEDQALAEAKKFASRHHKNVESFAVAFSNDPRHAHSPHRIDPKTTAFVPVTRERIDAGRRSVHLPPTTNKS
jgi:hypothetical protein